MAYFRYRAKDELNQTTEGIVQAATTDVAAELLRDQGLTILGLEEERRDLLQRSLKIFNRVRSKDIVIFSRQLSVIVSAAIPLVQGLRILVNQLERPVLRSAISEVADDVEGGAKLSSALSRHPEMFSNFYVSIVRSGETSGKLDEIMNYLADQSEKDYDLQSKMRGAMIYPAFIFGGLILVGILMMVFVVPELTGILQETGAQLPLTTRILIAVSDFLRNQWWLVAGIIGAIIIGLQIFLRTPNGQEAWSRFLLRLPIFGPLLQKIILVRFSQSLNTLLSGGVVLSKSLRIVADIVDNTVYKALMLETVREVEAGNPVATAFLRSKDVPLMVSQMLNLGEKTGRINTILEKIASFYTREVDNTVRNLVTLLEPLVMVIMGVAVGAMVSAIILPLYNVAQDF